MFPIVCIFPKLPLIYETMHLFCHFVTFNRTAIDKADRKKTAVQVLISLPPVSVADLASKTSNLREGWIKEKNFLPKNRHQDLKNMGFRIKDPEKTYSGSRIQFRNTDLS